MREFHSVAPSYEPPTAFPLAPGEGQGLSAVALAKADEGTPPQFIVRVQFCKELRTPMKLRTPRTSSQRDEGHLTGPNSTSATAGS